MKVVTNRESGTNVCEVADGIYRINTPVAFGGGFSFNQYLVKDDTPLLFHTGPRKMFSLVREAVESVLPVESLRFIGFSHVEADECGSLNEWLAAAPDAVPLCGKIAAMVSVDDLADRPARALADGEEIRIGSHSLRWIDAPHVPHGWETGYLMDVTAGTLLCGDLFTQPGPGAEPVTETDILGPSEALRQQLQYFSGSPGTADVLRRMASQEPTTLACMHGSSWRGDGGKLLRELATTLSRE